MVMENKKGWTTMIEVFVSILLLAGVMTLILNVGDPQETRTSEIIYKEQALALKIIQLDDSLRKDVLADTAPNNIIKETISSDFDCSSKICVLNEDCNLDSLPEEAKNKEIFVKSTLITATIDDYLPKELKLFCWEV